MSYNSIGDNNGNIYETIKRTVDDMWDLFISHASEDKETVVKQLADMLKKYGLKVWYDEFELKIGDSLSRSIDRGLADSTFGIIILSKAFFEKGWTDYELRSLLSREVSKRDKIILPVWHGIKAEDVLNYSPYLADKFALSTDIGLDELAYKIMETVKPDVINSIGIQKMFRKLLPYSELKEIEPDHIYMEEKVRHKTLPNYFVIATKLICEVLGDITDMDYRDVLYDFARDADYDHEFLIWNAIACSYISFIRDNKIDFSDLDIKRDIFSFLLGYTTGAVKDIEDWQQRHPKLTKEQYYELMIRYAQNHDFIMEYSGDSMKYTYGKILEQV